MPKYYYHNGRLYSEEELKHWKYIDKKKVNGKWRYYYDDSIERNFEKTKSDFETASLRTIAANSDLEFNRKLASQDGIYTPQERNTYNDNLKNYQARRSELETAGKKYIQAAIKLDNTRISRIASKIIVKAANWLSKIFSK